MARSDHPDPAAANAQALQDLENARHRFGAGVPRHDRRQRLRPRRVGGRHRRQGARRHLSRRRRRHRIAHAETTKGRPTTSPRWSDHAASRRARSTSGSATTRPLGAHAAGGAALRSRGAISRLASPATSPDWPRFASKAHSPPPMDGSSTTLAARRRRSSPTCWPSR